MLQVGDEWMYFAVVFLLTLSGTRSATGASVLTASLYVFLVMFRFPPVPLEQASRVLRPNGLSSDVPVVAHRAAGHDAPENTLAAIREASRNGATGVELDLSFTADGVAVLLHDDTVDRTTNGSGPISGLRLAHVKSLDAAARHRLRGERFGVQIVPTLQEALQECIKHSLTIFVNVKRYPDKAAAALAEMYRRHPVLYNSSIVCSFEPKVIYKMRQADPHVVTGLTHRPWSLSRHSDGTPRTPSSWAQFWSELLDVLLDWAHHHLLWDLCGVSAVLVHKDFISLDYVQYWAGRGVEVVGWPVNRAVEKHYYQDLLKISYVTDSLLEDCDPQY
ncbi:glycerophosphodiester phosphodiesterase 1 [Gadus morhua]|uniref:Glycerophosphodiester phosphodiesterase 1-like n=1 Tax=Gadus morhua TaxID=8049 RepID=A0A8C4ZRP5_GADMO|nr:glycerophosphodiester phosphodiesterase 1-like [Gadus morhua]